MKIFLIIVLVFLIFLAYMGMFSKITIQEKKMGPYNYAYVRHTGPYSQVGAPMMTLYEKMTKAGFNSTDGIGIYYDDPKKTPKEELRSDVGSIISEADISKIESNLDLNFGKIEQGDYLVAEFPIKNKMSYVFGPMKVYPLFNKYLKERGIEASSKGIEYYDMTNKKIIFLMEKN